MLRNRHRFMVIIIICYMMVFAIFGGLFLHKYNIADKFSLGNILFNNRFINYAFNLVYLDDFHSKMLLKKGLPIVRADKSEFIGEPKEEESIIKRTVAMTTDLPTSFFAIKQDFRVKKALSQAEARYNKAFEEKMRGEGSHENEELVKLDFWQTESNYKNGRNDNRVDISKGVQERLKLKKNQEETLPPKYSRNTGTPVIGIYHTHTAENYENRGYNARSKPGDKGDIVLIGDKLSKELKNKYGISTVHSSNVHDKVYSKSYINSLYTAKNMVKNNSALNMIFDIHRDSIGAGNRDLITTTINGKKVARIMIVVTDNKYGLPHPNWSKNLHFAKQLGHKINRMYPGLLRDVKLISNRRYNQHIHPQALLIEIGGAKSTVEEAKRSAVLLANVLATIVDEGV